MIIENRVLNEMIFLRNYMLIFGCLFSIYGSVSCWRIRDWKIKVSNLNVIDIRFFDKDAIFRF